MAEENQEKKIVVDEDWKSQVEAEKEALKAKEEAESAEAEKPATDDAPESASDSVAADPTATAADSAPGSDAEPAPEDIEDQEMPPASFPFLVTTFATQVLAALGQIPDPVDGKPVVRLGVARHFIDTLAILEEKTKGNLTSEEEQMLSGTLHHLRMAFVSAQSGASEQ